MFGPIRSEFQCLDRSGQNSIVSTDKARIPMLGQIRPELQRLDR